MSYAHFEKKDSKKLITKITDLDDPIWCLTQAALNKREN